jgi:ORF6N domain
VARGLAAAHAQDVTRAILTLQGQRVLLDARIAALYGVTTKRFNEQVRRIASASRPILSFSSPLRRPRL